MEGLKECLQELTKSVCKTINAITEALSEEDKVKRNKKAGRALKEIEVINDDAMRSGLGLSVNQIVQQKTRSRGSSKTHKSVDPKEPKPLTPFQLLMAHHAKHLAGPIPDGAAQGSAVKWILQYFTPEWAIQKYEAQLQERWREGKVSWLTVRQEIGRLQQNGTQSDATERNAGRLAGNLQLIQELRSDTGGDHNEVERGPTAVNS
jgi:hypothetical protein